MKMRSLLDTDLYKLTMQQLVLHQFSDVHVKYRFKCRTPNVNLVRHMAEIMRQVDSQDDVKATSEELDYLYSLPFFKDDYVRFLGDFRFNSSDVDIHPVGDGGGVYITVEGPWLQTILWEIPILSIVSETFFSERQCPAVHEEGERRLAKKLRKLRNLGVAFADFGTRRAFSRDWHAHVMVYLNNPANKLNFVGTSNVKHAMVHGVKPIGTMAHEVFQVCQALAHPVDSQRFAMQAWADEYRGQLGIALSDTLGLDKFLKDFDGYFARLYDGVRQDSGDPFSFADGMINHYTDLGIDPKTKTIVFSDGLDVDKIGDIERWVAGRIKTAYGIGTNLTNDLGPKPLQIVMKVVEANGQPVAKLSDSPGKEMCEDPDYVKYLRSVI